jgi:transcription antitermination factor NusG
MRGLINESLVCHSNKTQKRRRSRILSLNKGVEMFNPLMETFALRNGGMSKELKPLFLGYIFGKFDLEQNYPLVRWARGVKKVLGFGGYPTSISEEVVITIKARTDGQGIVRVKHHFKPNDVVQIKVGPMKDLLGIFERWLSDGERVRILLSLIGYQPVVEMHYSMIEKVA